MGAPFRSICNGLREVVFGRPLVPLNLNGTRGGDPVRPL